MTDELDSKQASSELRDLSGRLSALLDSDPVEAVRQARRIDPTSPDRFNARSLRAAIPVDGGAASRQQDAIEEGLALFRELHAEQTHPGIAYNLASGLVAPSDRYGG